MKSGVLHFAGYSPTYPSGSATKVELSISSTHTSYVLLEESQDQEKWSHVIEGLVKTGNDLSATYPITAGSDVRLKLYGGTGEMNYTLDFESAPPPVPKTLGECTISGSGIADGSVSLTVGDTLDLAAARDGDANPVSYKWSVKNGDAISFVGVTSKAAAQITATKAGSAEFRCMFTADASDSPEEKTVAVTVAEPPLGITAGVTKTPSTTPDDTGVITISGSKATHGATLNYIFKMDGRVQTPKSVAITTGMTAIQVATAVVDAFTDPDVTVSRSGGALTFAPESGSFLAKLTVSIE